MNGLDNIANIPKLRKGEFKIPYKKFTMNLKDMVLTLITSMNLQELYIQP